MVRWQVMIGVALGTACLPCQAQDPDPPAGDWAGLSAHRAVREGNERLTGGDPGKALEAYEHAEALEPEAREIAFVEGLAHFDLKDYDQARVAFHRAASLAGDALADDAIYSLGTCDHAEALASVEQDPQLALSRLESAMGRYHEVLQRRPEHQAARRANLKAASMWKELKRQLEQQPPQQSDSCDNPQEQDSDDQEKQDQEPKQSEDQEQQDSEKQQPQASDEQQEEQEREQQPSEEQQQQQEEEGQEQQAQPSEQEQVSREQAERQLREMMQDLRERKKMQRVPVQKAPVRPVDKDW